MAGDLVASSRYLGYSNSNNMPLGIQQAPIWATQHQILQTHKPFEVYNAARRGLSKNSPIGQVSGEERLPKSGLVWGDDDLNRRRRRRGEARLSCRKCSLRGDIDQKRHQSSEHI
jgi:hypothetical protein